MAIKMEGTFINQKVSGNNDLTTAKEMLMKLLSCSLLEETDYELGSKPTTLVCPCRDKRETKTTFHNVQAEKKNSMKKNKILAKFEAQDSGKWFRSFTVQQKGYATKAYRIEC